MTETLSYQQAGVDVDAGNQLVNNIKDIVHSTHQPGVLGGIGGFGGLFELPLGKYQEPVLVSCTDGVGTKLALAIEMKIHNSIGIDCVAMCVNDCVVSGAKPYLFLDYLATGKLEVGQAQEVVTGIANACKQIGVSLVGGETAEMPGMYKAGDYDVAGFCVGIVEKSKILDKSQVTTGDCLVGLSSSGVHSNGFSLVRKILETQQIRLHDTFEDSTYGQTLLTPTRLYVKQTLALTEQNLIKSCAHITGGGLTENIPRSIPDNLQANIDLNAWERPPIFNWLGQYVAPKEMLRTFNCGLGMVYAVAADKVEACLKTLVALGESPLVIGHLSEKQKDSVHYLGDF